MTSVAAPARRRSSISWGTEVPRGKTINDDGLAVLEASTTATLKRPVTCILVNGLVLFAAEPPVESTRLADAAKRALHDYPNDGS